MSPIRRPHRREVLVFGTPEQLRAWFEANHETATEAWIGYYRKGVDKTSISWPQAVDQALCFGWIDGIAYRVDDEVRANRFTPRRPGSNWSSVNVANVARLTEAGLMRPAGLAAFERHRREATAPYSYEHQPEDLPPLMLARLRADPAARADWEARPPSYRRIASFWVTSAKRPETRERRLGQLIERSAAGEPIKPLAYGRQSGRGSRP